MRGILKDTYLEMIDRKTVYMMGAVTIITLLIVLASGLVDVNFEMDIGSDLEELNDSLGNPIMKILNAFISFLIFLTIVATAGIFPNMLIKGRADYFLSKPISRFNLFSYKFISILIVYGAIIITSTLIVSSFVYFVHGLFDSAIFTLLSLNFISLFIWISITFFAGIVFGSTGMAIMSSLLIWVIQWLLSFHESISAIIDSPLVLKIIEGLYYIFPKTGEVSDITTALALGGNVKSMMPVYSSIIFAIVLIFSTVYIFKRKNY